MEGPFQSSGDIQNRKQVFLPQETLDDPFDVTLVVEDGKEFKAHRRVLSEASPFFEKLLKSDMRETNEGVIRLEMLTELSLREILEFVYTGCVQISAEGNARDLIAIADYLDLPHLKTVAGNVLVDKLNASNAVSNYYFAERYHCEGLISFSTNFIHANFTTVAKTKDFLNLSSKEVKRWISSDEIDVSAEEDVFNIILTWTEHEKGERKNDFVELFHELRLVHVSRDFLYGDIVTNDLVNDNESCVDLVKDAVKFADSQNFCHHSVKPRKSLEIPVMVFGVRDNKRQKDQVFCYFPRNDKWSRLPSTAVPGMDKRKVISCNDKLYFLSQQDNKLLCFDSFSDCWISLPYEEQRRLHQFFVTNDELYALVSEDRGSCTECVSLSSSGTNSFCGKKHQTFIMKYKPESNLWENVSSFDLGSRNGICIVPEGSFIYFVGGYCENQDVFLADADRYNLGTNTWDKIANIQEPRMHACGAAAHGKIFISGGLNGNDQGNKLSESCEVYHKTTNEWQFITNARFRTPSDSACIIATLLCVDSVLYLLMHNIFGWIQQDKVGCLYELYRDEWSEKSQIPNEKMLQVGKMDVSNFITFCCSMRVFKGCSFLQEALGLGKVSKHKCAIM